MIHGHELLWWDCWRKGGYQLEGVKGKNWDNCNSIVNKIYFENKKNSKYYGIQKKRGINITIKLTGCKLVLCVDQNALQGGWFYVWLSSILIYYVFFLQTAGQIHDRHIGCRDTENYSNEISIHSGMTLPHSLSYINVFRDDDLSTITTNMTPFSTGATHIFHGESNYLNCNHEYLNDPIVVFTILKSSWINNLDQCAKQFVV